MPMPVKSINARRGARRRGFTLIEVMISVVLVLIVVFGVSQVFTMATQTVGAGAALSNIVRDNRAGQHTMHEDFRNSLPDSPLFIIWNEPAISRVTSPPGFGGAKKDTVDGNPNVIRGFRAGYFNKRAEDTDVDG